MVTKHVTRARSKEHPGPTASRRARPLDPPRALPSRYDETRLALIEVQPSWVHAFWDLAPAHLARARRDLGEQGTVVLRFYDVTMILFDGTNDHGRFDVVVGPEARSWYLDLWSPGRSFLADVGLRASGGRFFALARSGAVELGRSSQGAEGPVEWMRVDGDPRRARGVGSATAGAEPSPPADHPGPIDPGALMTRLCREDVVHFYRGLEAGAAP